MTQPHKRLTIDLPPQDHVDLKGICAFLGMSMRDFVIAAVHKQMEDYEDQLDYEAAKAAIQRMESGEETPISWRTMEKRLGWNEL